jgi:hypothetical protein
LPWNLKPVSYTSLNARHVLGFDHLILPVFEGRTLSQRGTNRRVVADLFGHKTKAFGLIHKLVGLAEQGVEWLVY